MLTTAAIAAAISGANAGTVTLVDSLSTFDAGTSGQTTSNFDSFGVTGSNFVNFNSLTTDTATFTGTQAGNAAVINLNGPSFAASGGNDFLTNTFAGQTFTGVYALTISLSSAVTAFGLDFGTTFMGQTVTFTLSDSGTSVATEQVTTAQSFSNAIDFVGFISSDPFNTITLSLVGPSGLGVEDVTTATAGVAATLLPAALPLFAGGLGALGLLGWRRKRTARSLAV
jgi:hypothetical protein